MEKVYFKIKKNQYQAKQNSVNSFLKANFKQGNIDWIADSWAREYIVVIDPITGDDTNYAWFPIPVDDPIRSMVIQTLTPAQVSSAVDIRGRDDVKYVDTGNVPPSP